MSLTVHTATPMVLMTTNEDATQYAPGRPRPMTQNEMVLNRIQDMTFNLTSLRSWVLSQFMDPRRDVNKECGYPETTNYAARDYQDLFDREPIANRAVSLLPKESWQVQPEVYEEESSDEPTEFERAWDDLSRALRGGSKYQDEEGNPVWDYLMRADILSGVGAFGVILLGFDDVKVAGGKSLRDPVDLLTEDEMTVEEPVEGEEGDGPTDEDRMAGVFGKDDPEDEPNEDDMEELPLATDDEEEEDDGDARPMPEDQAEPDEEDEVDDPTDPYEEESEEDDPNAGLEQDEMGIGEETDEEAAPKFEAKVKLKYLRVFSEALVKVSVSEADPASPRFGQPVIYQIQLNDPTQQQAGIGLSMGTVDVHWTRIIHLAEHLVNSEVYAASRMQVVLNRLLDLRKMYGASGEGYWKQAFATMVLETDPALGGDVNVNRANIRDEMEKLENGLTRSMLLNGMSAKTLPPSVTDPTPYLTKHIEAICVYLGCPVRVFLGSERGELASSQDDAAWNDRLKFRQQYYLTPRVIVPFVDRLIKAGTLPLPRGFSVRWPDLTSSTDSEKATVANTKTTALAAYVSGGIEALLPPLEFLTKIMGMDEEEAQGILDSATKLNEGQMAEQQMMAEEQGFVPDPTDPTGKMMIDPDQQEMENEIELAKAENPTGVQTGGGGPPPFGGKPKPGGFPPKKPGGGGKPPFVKNEEEIVDLVVAT